MTKRGLICLILIILCLTCVVSISYASSCYKTGEQALEDVFKFAEEKQLIPSGIELNSLAPGESPGFLIPKRPSTGAITDVPLSSQNALSQSEQILKSAESASYGSKNLDSISQTAREMSPDQPVTTVFIETNGYRSPSGTTDLNEMRYANQQGHENIGNLVVQGEMDNYDQMGNSILERYNADLPPEQQIQRVPGYTRVGTKGAGLFFSGAVDNTRLRTVMQDVMDESRTSFLNNVPAEVSRNGEVLGFKVSIGTGRTAEDAYREASFGYGSGTLKNGNEFGQRGTNSIVTFDEIDTNKQVILEYTRPSGGLDTPDSSGLTLRQKMESARTAYSQNPSAENLKNLQDVTNEVSFIANTNPVSGSVTVPFARRTVSPGTAISSGGEENFIIYQSKKGERGITFSDMDGCGAANRACNLELSNQVLSGVVSPNDIAVGGKIDASLYKMQQITQRNLDLSGGAVNAEVVNRIRSEIAEQTGFTRSYAMYNGVDGTIPGLAADSNVKSLVSADRFAVSGLSEPVSIDKFNEMVISVAKSQPDKNSVAVLQQLSGDGRSGIITVYNDLYPKGKQFQVVFDPVSVKTTIIGEVK